MSLFKGTNHMLTLTWIGFVMHEVVYFGRFVPFWICDFIPAMQKYKIQAQKDNTWDAYMKCLKTLAFNHFLVQLPMMLGFHPLAELFGMGIVTKFPPLYVASMRMFELTPWIEAKFCSRPCCLCCLRMHSITLPTAHCTTRDGTSRFIRSTMSTLLLLELLLNTHTPLRRLFLDSELLEVRCFGLQPLATCTSSPCCFGFV